MTQQRYANYVRDVSEPDLETLSPHLPGTRAHFPSRLAHKDGSRSASEAPFEARIDAATGVLTAATLRTTAAILDALADEDRVGKSGRRP